MEEVWKDIPEYEGLYEVSNMGRVRSLGRYLNVKNGYKAFRKGKMMTPVLNNAGRECLVLYKNKKPQLKQVPHLVLEAFEGPRPTGMECSHKDGNKLNNIHNNLKWDTHLNNIRDKRKHNTQLEGESVKMSKLKEKDVILIRWMLKVKHISHKKISELFNVSRPTITRINTNKIWRHIQLGVDR